MRKLFVACTLFAVGSPLMGQPVEPPAQPLQGEIHLPSITRKWKRSDQPDGPETTIEDIERCIGQDVDMMREVKEVKQRQAQLESERIGLDKVNADLRQSAEAVDKSRAALQAQKASFQSASVRLDQQLSALEKKKGKVLRSQADVDAINAQVQAYNAEIGKQNKWRAQLLSEQDAFNKSVEKHNAAVAEANRDVQAFNERNDTFQNMAGVLTRKSQAYVAHCAGERVLKK